MTNLPFLAGLKRFNFAGSGFSEVINTSTDPVHMLLDRNQHVAQHRRAAWSRDRKQVGETAHLQTKIGNRAVLPFFRQLKPVPTSDIGFQQFACECRIC